MSAAKKDDKKLSPTVEKEIKKEVAKVKKEAKKEIEEAKKEAEVVAKQEIEKLKYDLEEKTKEMKEAGKKIKDLEGQVNDYKELIVDQVSKTAKEKPQKNYAFIVSLISLFLSIACWAFCFFLMLSK